MMTKLYALLGTGILGFYTTAGVMGWEQGGYGKETPEQAKARHASGGHRTGYYSIFRGGK
jgi:hypothetical protein